jgi:hypothetical protein
LQSPTNRPISVSSNEDPDDDVLSLVCVPSSPGSPSPPSARRHSPVETSHDALAFPGGDEVTIGSRSDTQARFGSGHLEPAHASEVIHWKTSASRDIEVLPDRHHILIHADSVSAASDCLLAILIHLYAGRAMTNFVPPDGVLECRKTISLSSFHQPYLDFKMYVVS